MPFLQWIADYRIGDLASIAGLIISVIGFIATLWNVRRSRRAAERAEASANEARLLVRTYQSVADFSAAIAIMEEIKRLHRTGQADMLLDRYAALRKVLVGVRRLSLMIDDEKDQLIQSAIATLTSIEGVVERSRAEGTTPNFVRLNRLLSKEIDGLHSILVGLTVGSENT
jgi:hypothetical protein